MASALTCAGGDRGAAPRAALDLQHRQPVRAVLVGLRELLVGLLEALRADVGADPQPDPERLHAPGRLVLAAGQLGRAHQRGRALELLGGEQPQRVAHQHRDPVAPVERAVGGLDHALPAADRERVRRQAEIRLGLAAAGREEQQLDPRLVLGAAQRRRRDR